MKAYRRNPYVIVSTALVLVSLLVGACAQATPTTTAPSETEAPSTTQPVTAATKVVLNIDSGALTDQLNAFVPEIKQDLNIDLEIIGTPVTEQYETNMMQFMSGNVPFDLVSGWHFLVGDYGPYLEPLENVGDLAELKLDDIEPAFYKFYNWYQEKLIGITIDGDLRLYNYRTDLFNDPQEQAAFKEKYGWDLRPPQTWEEYLQIGEFFTRPDKDLFGICEATIYFMRPNFIERYITYEYEATGGKLYGFLWDEKMHPLVNGEIGLKAMNNYIESLKYMPPLQAKKFEWGDVRKAFYDGRCAQVPTWTDLAKTGSDPTYSKVTDKMGFDVLPGGLSDTAYGRFLGIPKSSKNKEAAFKVLVWLSSPENSSRWVGETAPLALIDPWRISHFEHPELTFPLQSQSGTVQDFTEASKTALEGKIYPDPDMPGMARYIDVDIRIIQEALSGAKTAQEALDAMAAEWEQITDDMGRDKQIASWLAYIKRMVDAGYWSMD